MAPDRYEYFVSRSALVAISKLIRHWDVSQPQCHLNSTIQQHVFGTSSNARPFLPFWFQPLFPPSPTTISETTGQVTSADLSCHIDFYQVSFSRGFTADFFRVALFFWHHDKDLDGLCNQTSTEGLQSARISDSARSARPLIGTFQPASSSILWARKPCIDEVKSDDSTSWTLAFI